MSTAQMMYKDQNGQLQAMTSTSPGSVAFGTAVTSNTLQGVLTYTVSTAASTSSTSVVNCTAVSASSNIHLTIQSYSGSWGTNGYPFLSVNAVSAATSFTIRLTNLHTANALTGTLVIHYTIQNI